MNKKIPNIYMAIGLMAGLLYFIGNRFFNFPDFFMGLALGIATVFFIIGLIAINHDISKLRAFKIKLFNKAVK